MTFVVSALRTTRALPVRSHEPGYSFPSMSEGAAAFARKSSVDAPKVGVAPAAATRSLSSVAAFFNSTAPISISLAPIVALIAIFLMAS